MTENTATHIQSTKTLPVVRNLREAAASNALFDAIITAGPKGKEVKWGHPNHFVQTFDDVTYKTNWYTPPSIDAVERMIAFAAEAPDNLLIHCHAGISRSTATAIGSALVRGWDLEDAITALILVHPEGRPFSPNTLILTHLEDIFGFEGLVEYATEQSHNGHGW